MIRPDTAREILRLCRASADFFTLDTSTVCALLDYADEHRYRAPRNANGSRGRYWHAYLSRRAARNAS